jgi:hypothetical protein
MKSSPKLEQKLLGLSKKGLLIPRSENNQYLKVSYKGANNLVSDKWNIKIYTSGSIVCNDYGTLNGLIQGTLKTADSSLSLLQIDDSGVGFPLCGAMVGVTDGEQVWTEIIDVSFFQGSNFEKQLYLEEYAQKGLSILQKIRAEPSRHRIEICTGFINTRLKDILRDLKFDVQVTEVKGLLQDSLEDLFKLYVKQQTGKDLAYDPKELEKNNIGAFYYSALNWGKNFKPKLLKTGWQAIRNSM